MFSAIASATGDYCMIFDDDDDLFTGRLPEVCERLSRQGADGKIAGFVFSMVLGQPEATASPFPSECSNLIKMRADEGVVGDRKEIIRTHLLKQVAVPPRGGSAVFQHLFSGPDWRSNTMLFASTSISGESGICRRE